VLQNRHLAHLCQLSAARYFERVGKEFPVPVKSHPLTDDTFIASVRSEGDGAKIEVSDGVFARLTEAWGDVLSLSSQLPEEHRMPLLGEPGHAVETSLNWLLQHELTFVDLGFSVQPVQQACGLGDDPVSAAPPDLLSLWLQEQNTEPNSLDQEGSCSDQI